MFVSGIARARLVKYHRSDVTASRDNSVPRHHGGRIEGPLNALDIMGRIEGPLIALDIMGRIEGPQKSLGPSQLQRIGGPHNVDITTYLL